MRVLPNDCRELEAESFAQTVYLTPQQARFYRSGDFLAMDMTDPSVPEQTVSFSRVTLRRAFPFDSPWQYILVSDKEDQELGMIVDVADFGDAEALLREELERFYHTPKIKGILSLKERAGFSYWEVETEEGVMSFTVQDTFRNILRIGEDRAAVFDADGNRFEIDSIAALDRKSHKKIELYL